MSNIDKRALREELSNPAIGSNAHLRKLALALLDELEAKDKRNAELEDLLEAEIKSWMQRYDSANNRREAAEKRIAELEARMVKLPERYEVDMCPTPSPDGEWYSREDILAALVSADVSYAADNGKGE